MHFSIDFCPLQNGASVTKLEKPQANLMTGQLYIKCILSFSLSGSLHILQNMITHRNDVLSSCSLSLKTSWFISTWILYVLCTKGVFYSPIESYHQLWLENQDCPEGHLVQIILPGRQIL